MKLHDRYAAATCLAVFMLTPYAEAQDRIFANAEVWTGDGFQTRDLAVRDGVFIPATDVADDAERVDLSGRFVVPPYANAHHHITYGSESSSWNFVQHGVFYVWNPNTVTPRNIEADNVFFEQPETYDVRSAMGGITEPLGHPERLYVDILTQWVYQDWEFEDFLGNAFHYGRTPQEIDAALDLLLEQGADFVKTYLLYSEDYAERSGNEAYYGLAGLNPENFPYLAEAAHARGLPVAVHVQTREDALTAARAGADMLAHLPAYSVERGLEAIQETVLSPADAEEMAASGIIVVPTYAIARRNSVYDQPDPDLLAATYEAQAENLRVLHAAGVPILTGTDGPEEVVSEIDHWIEIGGLSQLEAFNALFATAEHLFPERALGQLQPGYEASFLVLQDDPLERISALQDIQLRVKQGHDLVAPDEAPGEDEEED